MCIFSPPTELPWDKPTESCQEYADWLQKKTYLPPWKKIQPLPLSKRETREWINENSSDSLWRPCDVCGFGIEYNLLNDTSNDGSLIHQNCGLLFRFAVQVLAGWSRFTHHHRRDKGRPLVYSRQAPTLEQRELLCFWRCCTYTCVRSNLQVQSERFLNPETSFLSPTRRQYPGPGQGLSFVFSFFVSSKTKCFTGPAAFMPSSVLCSDDGMQFSTSQPDLAAGGSEAVSQLTCCKEQVSFSQPIKPEHMLLTTQLLCTPGASQVKTTATAVCFIVKSQRKRLFENRCCARQSKELNTQKIWNIKFGL